VGRDPPPAIADRLVGADRTAPIDRLVVTDRLVAIDPLVVTDRLVAVDPLVTVTARHAPTGRRVVADLRARSGSRRGGSSAS